MWTIVPDTEYCGIHSMRAGLYEGVWGKESVGGIDYKVKHEDDLFLIGSSPLEVVLRSYLNGTGLGECQGD